MRVVVVVVVVVVGNRNGLFFAPRFTHSFAAIFTMLSL